MTIHQMAISAREETTREEIETYVAAIGFLAYWFEKQDGANGKDTEALFEEMRGNICDIMIGNATRV